MGWQDSYERSLAAEDEAQRAEPRPRAFSGGWWVLIVLLSLVGGAMAARRGLDDTDHPAFWPVAAAGALLLLALGIASGVLRARSHHRSPARDQDRRSA